MLITLAASTENYIYTICSDEDCYSPSTCHYCHSLQYYLLNVTKYFTSNTQLLFLPGLHHLHTDLIIQNVHNISLIGSTGNGKTPDTVTIQCRSSVGIIMTNITDLTIKDMQLDDCQTTSNSLSNKKHVFAVQLKDCYDIQLNSVTITGKFSHPLLAVNALGNSSFINLACNRLVLLYNEVNMNNKYHNVLIDNYTTVPIKITTLRYYTNSTITDRTITVFMFQYLYSVKLEVINTKFICLSESNCHLFDLKVTPNEYGNSIHFNQCTFENYQCDSGDIFHLESQMIPNTAYLHKQYHQVKFSGCNFFHNEFVSVPLGCVFMKTKSGLINVIIEHCIFENTLSQIVHMENDFKQINHFKSIYHKLLELPTVLISNTTFRHIRFYCGEKLIELKGTVLQLEGPVVFVNVHYQYISYLDRHIYGYLIFNNCKKLENAGIICVADIHSMVICHNYIDFSNTRVSVFTFSTYYGDGNTNMFIVIKENSFINMTNSKGPSQKKEVINATTVILQNEYNIFNNLPCFFQYVSQRGNLDTEISNGGHFNVSIEIDKDMQEYYLMTHCRWLPSSAFTTARPIDINKKLIKNFHVPPKVLCFCLNDSKQDCYTDTIATAYPGQSITVTVMLSVNRPYIPTSKFWDLSSTKMNGTKITVVMNDNEVPPTSCKLGNTLSEATQLVYDGHCTAVYYTIVHSTLSYMTWCELFVKVYPNHFEGFYVNILSCPPGFIQSNGICVCDPILTLALQVTECDINHQTILRPAGSWSSAVTISDSHQYHTSPQCPLHYCLPQSSQLNFSTPNSQCQFNRNGLLCGQCQQDLSTIFGYSNCQHCSNIYLLLIIPIAVAGLVLVLLLFILNLTVTDGDINGFILCVNIISINNCVFFPQCNIGNYHNFWHIFISFANLDLGIPTCFYHGMDDYAKMWLQLAFPAYLILIATLLIIASRHSTTVQRITARRALPVLATLFLLSYTKVLRTVSSVLFYFSTITHLPSGHTTLVWAVDANVPLFGLKYIVLFIVCLVLFIILLPFNAVLCFTKLAMRLRLVNHFKPLIDAYQGPYKFKYYYWTGLQLVMRAVFFGLSALDRNNNLTISIALLAAIILVQAKISPFKREYKNINDLSHLYILLLMYIFSYEHYNTVIKILIIMTAIQFLFIITYHIIVNLCGEQIMYKIRNITGLMIMWLTRSHVQNNPRQIELNTVPPDVTFNYSEFQEPLVGNN